LARVETLNRITLWYVCSPYLYGAVCEYGSWMFTCAR